MENEEEVQEVEETEELETTDSQNGEVEETTEEKTNDEDVEALKSEIEELKEKNKKLYARATKTKSLSKKPSTDLDYRGIASNVSALSGETDEVVDAMEMISKVKSISLAEAKKDPIVLALKEKLDREAKSVEAGLGASGKGLQKSTSNYLENSKREDHMKKWKAMTGN